MKYITNLLHEYKSINDICDMSDRDPSDILLGTILTGIPVYFVNQSYKTLTYIPFEYNSKKFFSKATLKKLLHIGFLTEGIEKGQLLEIRTIKSIDHLLKNVLNERDLFFVRPDGDYYLAGKIGVFSPTLGWHANFLINKYHDVTLKHTYLKVKDFPKLAEHLKNISESKNTETDNSKSKQQQRELVFLRWLQTQDEQAVPNMKKEDVWKELQKLDRALFSVESKNFFRDQKIITFKSGRKPS